MRVLVVLVLIALAGAAQAGNRLATEASPYLRQHADNPVDWYPWGPEALEKARAEDKMIFVSVGYAACHWCHVMEDESFENDAIAAYLNQHFVAIKIDRERRPDLDEQFIIATSALAGSSGWPNSVFLTPDGAPFYGGTYFPPDYFMGVMQRIVQVWEEDNAELRAQAQAVAERLRSYFDQTAALADVTPEQLHLVAGSLLGDLDEFNGGFGTAPKFPQEHLLAFLLDQAGRQGDAALLEAVTLTLDGMVRGGIHDHLGGGFHRYGTDPEWAIPHFEKMLYNQALIGRILVDAYSITGAPDYARAATRTFDYALRDMRSDDGAFFAAEDADSRDAAGARVEGAYYIWTPDEIRAVLADRADPLIDAFGVEEQGEFEGANVLRLTGMPLESGLNDAALEDLRRARLTRPAPIRDQKVILAWNADMIVTLARASRILQRPDYARAAIRAGGFLADNMWQDGDLHRIWFEGAPDTDAQLTDYAAFGRALLALHDLGDSSGHDWLALADALAVEMLRRFGDEGKSLRMNETAQALGPFRPLDDNEVASGNAQALEFLTRLDRRLARNGEAAPRLASVLAAGAVRAPGQRAATLTALALQQSGPTGVLRVSSGDAVRVQALADPSAQMVNVHVSFRDGWHVNAHEPLDDYLIGMALSVDGTELEKSGYPEPRIKELGFSETPLAIYENAFVLKAPLKQGGVFTTLRLTLQACSDEICLPPDDMVFRFWPDGG